MYINLLILNVISNEVRAYIYIAIIQSRLIKDFKAFKLSK